MSAMSRSTARRFADLVLQVASSAVIAALLPAILAAVYLASVRLPLELAEAGSAPRAYLHYGLISVAVVAAPGLVTAVVRPWTPKGVVRSVLTIAWVLLLLTVFAILAFGFFPMKPPWVSWSWFGAHIIFWGQHLEFASALVVMAIASSDRGSRQRWLRYAAVMAVPVGVVALLVVRDSRMPWTQ